MVDLDAADVGGIPRVPWWASEDEPPTRFNYDNGALETCGAPRPVGRIGRC